jgi:hypothetical protein
MVPIMINNPSLFDGEGDDDGAGKDPRLSKQIDRVFEAMSDGQWHSIPELSLSCNASQTSVSARFRDFRKPRFGGHEVERSNGTSGCYYYRLHPNGDPLDGSGGRSAKQEARIRLTAYLDRHDEMSANSNMHPTNIHSLGDRNGDLLHCLASDIREMLR